MNWGTRFVSLKLYVGFSIFDCISFLLKSGSHLPKKMFLFASIMMKNDKNDEKDDEKCFLFHVKALFVLKILRFLSWLFGHVEETAWLEDMTSQPG